MATRKTTAAPQPTPRPLAARTGRALGEAVDGHTQIAVGWRAARHPSAVEARAAKHEAEVASYLEELLADYSA